MSTQKLSLFCIGGAILCILGSGCTDGSGVSGTKPGAGGFTKEERAKMQAGPSQDDKKAMQQYMSKHTVAQPAPNAPVK